MDQRYLHPVSLLAFPSAALLVLSLLLLEINYIQSKPAMVLLPTPPFALATAMTFETSRIRCFGGRPRVRLGIVPVLGRAFCEYIPLEELPAGLKRC